VDPFTSLVAALHAAHVRFVLIGVWGANFWARSASTVFTTQDYDLLLPLDADDVLRAWRVCEQAGLRLWVGDEPLDEPRDLALARRVVDRRALVRATDGRTLDVDLTLTMSGFDFETVWRDRRSFRAEGIDIPVARLRHIVESKAAAGRPKDRLFLATHEEALRDWLRKEP
jgi:hypothetical protein